ncbi:MAG: GNAT family N-acetyltransferase [Aridibacter famidurans]|nr:GNAT family N-acetyltransferase [Aridibacter famidurans]
MNTPIHTKRLTIRRFEPSDLEPFLEFMTDEGSTRYLQFEEEHKSIAGATGLFEAVLAAYDSDEPVHSYAIADRESGEYLGSCGYAPYSEGICEVYYAVNRKHSGKGIATEATRAIAELLAEDFEVRAYCAPENKAAHRVALAAGFEDQGLATHEAFGNEGRLFVFKR